MSSFLDTLKSIDDSILLFINGMHSPFWDNVMMGISNRFAWIPLYALLAYIIIRKFGKSSWLIIVFGVITVALSDQVASHLIKNIFLRYRPSHNLLLAPHLHFVDDYMGGQYGFVSSHASNTFGIAVFIMLVMPKSRGMIVALFGWAALVCYSRMYLGVHYPSDIVGGAVVGAVCAWVCYRLWMFTAKCLSLN